MYILDSGIRYSHQVFGGRASFGGYDEFGGRGDDDHGHGTHCAGLAAGRLTGVAWGARVYRCVLSSDSDVCLLHSANVLGKVSLLERVLYCLKYEYTSKDHGGVMYL